MNTDNSGSVNDGSQSMTDGPIFRRILLFAIPIFLGNLFQQLYNVADALIVGNFLGSDSLAAVTSTGALIFIMIGFFNGMAIGSGVVVAHWFGAKDDRRLSLAVHTMASVGILCGVIMTIVGVVFTPQLLILMNSPTNVLPQSVAYLRVYFAGILALTTYNTQVGILQSVGDSRHPLYYLIISSLMNLVLDTIFIGVFRRGVAAAGLATVMSQAFSSFLCYRRLSRTTGAYRLDLRKLGFSREVLPDVLKNGVPTGIQNSVISLANVVVQASINTFGSMAMAGCGSYSKVEGFVFLPTTALSMAITTFVSQNRGAQRPDRARKGAIFGISIGSATCELIGFFYLAAAPLILSAFSRDPEVLAFGIRQTQIECLFYCLLSFSHLSAATLRGYGKAVWPTIVMLCIWCIFRIPYVVIGLHYVNRIEWIFSAYPVTWGMSSIIYAMLLPKFLSRKNICINTR